MAALTFSLQGEKKSNQLDQSYHDTNLAEL